jgi:hypothetical protein
VHFAGAFSAFARRNDPFAQIFTQGFHAPSKPLFSACVYLNRICSNVGGTLGVPN